MCNGPFVYKHPFAARWQHAIHHVNSAANVIGQLLRVSLRSIK